MLNIPVVTAYKLLCVKMLKMTLLLSRLNTLSYQILTFVNLPKMCHFFSLKHLTLIRFS